jgi:anti-sigma B factor antagonist
MESAMFDRDDGSPPRLVVTGEIDLDVADAFRDELQAVIDAAHSPAYVDLSGVTFFNSTGIGVLVALQQEANRRDVQLVIDPSPSVTRVLELTGLMDQFNFGTGP